MALLTAHNSSSIWTRDSVRIVAVGGQTSAFAGKRQSIWTSLNNWLIVSWITFVVVITIFFMRKNGSTLAFAGSTKVDGRLRGLSLCCN